ncbi:hypothetical protein PHYSODRAFT_530641 [Phytophthora sojae]|uniref:Uncharacterized protein n=1 Tax=Phytophthora sojae (strain P6497) TaxID=1094619 RepID=G5ACP0_PHYSP|nr:hypothetical protein PHYSODRAFT_530641 [Phytophthora sojae]EGZ07114.1 hypothetical protein PHYSODRAFT_530641 [Phytophthora sojae]|eukprot:XP_009537878.1 hypothetical protein PHYSODRAFT_530641 [Phytophthora sojae]
MGSVRKVYNRLNLPLPYDPDLQGMRLNNLFRMANYRVRTVGISEIETTFRASWRCQTKTCSNLYDCFCVKLVQ